MHGPQITLSQLHRDGHIVSHVLQGLLHGLSVLPEPLLASRLDCFGRQTQLLLTRRLRTLRLLVVGEGRDYLLGRAWLDEVVDKLLQLALEVRRDQVATSGDVLLVLLSLPQEVYHIYRFRGPRSLSGHLAVDLGHHFIMLHFGLGDGVIQSTLWGLVVLGRAFHGTLRRESSKVRGSIHITSGSLWF